MSAEQDGTDWLSPGQRVIHIHNAGAGDALETCLALFACGVLFFLCFVLFLFSDGGAFVLISVLLCLAGLSFVCRAAVSPQRRRASTEAS